MICLFDQKEFEIVKTKDLLKFECEYCHSTYERSKIQYLQHIRNQKKMSSFCSPKCRSLGEGTLVSFSCVQCQKEFIKPKKEISKNNFCSQSCSAIWTNKNYNKAKKRLPEKECNICNTSIPRNIKTCRTCRDDKETSLSKNILLEKGIRFYHRTIRNKSRYKYMKSDKIKQCYICGYNKHIEVAHIKSVENFDKNSLLSEINSLDNLIALCPNHHWELDHGLLKL